MRSAVDITKLSTGVGGFSDRDVAKGNVVPIRPSKAETSAAVNQAQAPSDRFTRSSLDTETADGTTDTVTLTSVSELVPSDVARQARVADVIAAVRNGTYQVDSESVANVLLSRMLNQATGADHELPSEQV